MRKIEYTVEGRLQVFVDGTVVSEHNQPREAEEAAVNALFANPDADVYYTQPNVRVELLGGEEAAEPAPEPGPGPEPEPEPSPDPQPDPDPDPQPDPPSTGDGFEATWPTADTSSEGAFPHMLDNDNLLSVVDGRPMGFPGNALEIMADDRGTGSVKGAQPQVRTQHGLIPVPKVGETQALRYYLRIESPDSFRGDVQTHGTQDGDGFSLRNWMHQITVHSNGVYTLSLDVSNGLSGEELWPNNKWQAVLPKFRTLRLEHQIEAVSASQFKLRARIYDGDELIADDGDFKNINATASLLSEPLHNFGNPGLESLRAFRTGLNGISHGQGFPFVFAYIGNLAIRKGGWIGA